MYDHMVPDFSLCAASSFMQGYPQNQLSHSTYAQQRVTKSFNADKFGPGCSVQALTQPCAGKCGLYNNLYCGPCDVRVPSDSDQSKGTVCCDCCGDRRMHTHCCQQSGVLAEIPVFISSRSSILLNIIQSSGESDNWFEDIVRSPISTGSH